VLALLPVRDPHDGTEDDEVLWHHSGGGPLRGVTRAMYSRGFDEILIAESGTDTVSVWQARDGRLLQQFSGAPPSLKSAAQRGGSSDADAMVPNEASDSASGPKMNAIASTCVVMDREERRVCIGTATGDFISVVNPANGAHLRELCLLEGAGDPRRRAEAKLVSKSAAAAAQANDSTVRSIVCVYRALPGGGKNAPMISKLIVAVAGTSILVFDDSNPDEASES